MSDRKLSRLLVCAFALVLLLYPLAAQKFSSEGAGPSEKQARKDADSKLEYQFEVSIKTVAALSKIVEELGQSMKYDPAADLAIYPTSSVGLAGLEYKLKPRKTNDTYRVVATLDPAKVAPLYLQGLANLRTEILNMNAAAKAAQTIADRGGIYEELLVFIKEYRVYRNLAVLLGFSGESIPFSPVPERDIVLALEQAKSSAGTIAEAAASCAALVIDSGVYLDFIKDASPEGAEFGEAAKSELIKIFKAKKIKVVSAPDQAKTILKIASCPMKDKDGSLFRLEVQARLISLQRSDLGVCRRSLVLAVLPGAFTKPDLE